MQKMEYSKLNLNINSEKSNFNYVKLTYQRNILFLLIEIVEGMKYI